MVTGRCPHCSKMFQVAEQSLGTMHSCQGCGRSYALPRRADRFQEDLDTRVLRDQEEGEQVVIRKQMLLILLAVFVGVPLLLVVACIIILGMRWGMGG